MQTCTIWTQRLLVLLTVTLVAMLAQPADQSRGYTSVTATANTDNLPFVVLNSPPGPLMMRGVTLKKLITDAFGLPGFQVTDGPPWVNTERWDFRLQTVAPIMPIEQYRQVLLRSLNDCFQLMAHRETRVAPVYELTMTGPGPNIRPDPDLDARGPVIKNGSGSIHLRNSSLAEFANLLSLHLGRPVIDKTRAPGLFRISLDWDPVSGEDGGPEAGGLPPGTAMPTLKNGGQSIFPAIQEQLGLRLTPEHGPVEVILIEKAEKPRLQ
jgi:uncharacterized protein (TIGR03435 family)